MQQNEFCPVCRVVYRATDTDPMVGCDHCPSWVHISCDGIDKVTTHSPLSACLPVCLPVCLAFSLSLSLKGIQDFKMCSHADSLILSPLSLSTCLSVLLSLSLPLPLPAYLPVSLSASLSCFLSLSACLPACSRPADSAEGVRQATYDQMSRQDTQYTCPVCRSLANKQKQLRKIQHTIELKVRFCTARLLSSRSQLLPNGLSSRCGVVH
jgi:hypothetical protein